MKELIGKRPIRIEIDGGVSPDETAGDGGGRRRAGGGRGEFPGRQRGNLPREYRGDQAGGGQGQDVTALPMPPRSIPGRQVFRASVAAVSWR